MVTVLIKKKYGTTDMFDIAKKLFPKATDAEIDFILFEKTCYPLNNAKALEQLEQLVGKVET